MSLYDIAVARKLSGGGGGGGSCDFHKATVSVTASLLGATVDVDFVQDSKPNFTKGPVPIQYNGGFVIDEDAGVSALPPTYVDSEETQTIELYLYKSCYANLSAFEANGANVYTVTGDAEIIDVYGDESSYFVRITGDCTITVAIEQD